MTIDLALILVAALISAAIFYTATLRHRFAVARLDFQKARQAGWDAEEQRKQKLQEELFHVVMPVVLNAIADYFEPKPEEPEPEEPEPEEPERPKPN